MSPKGSYYGVYLGCQGLGFMGIRIEAFMVEGFQVQGSVRVLLGCTAYDLRAQGIRVVGSGSFWEFRVGLRFTSRLPRSSGLGDCLVAGKLTRM